MDHLGFSTATADLVQFLQFLFTIQTYFVGIHVGSRRFAATISNAGGRECGINSAKFLCFQSEFGFSDTNCESPWKPG